MTAADWDRIYEAVDRPFGLTSPLDSFWPPGLDVDPGIALEVCAGYGRHQRALRSHHSRVIAVDFSLQAARLFSSRTAHPEIVCADVRQLPFRDGQFCAIYCITDPTTVCNVTIDAKVRAEIRRTLIAPDGIFIVVMLKEGVTSHSRQNPQTAIDAVVQQLRLSFGHVRSPLVTDSLTMFMAS